MELRRKEPDFRFRVVQTMRSVNRKRDRSFLPPTAFCGAKGRIQAGWTQPRGPPTCPQCPRDSEAQGEVKAPPTSCPESEAELGLNLSLLLGWKRQGDPWKAGMSRSVNKVGR